jgi:hypothetical protein
MVLTGHTLSGALAAYETSAFTGGRKFKDKVILVVS